MVLGHYVPVSYTHLLCFVKLVIFVDPLGPDACTGQEPSWFAVPEKDKEEKNDKEEENEKWEDLLSWIIISFPVWHIWDSELNVNYDVFSGITNLQIGF